MYTMEKNSIRTSILDRDLHNKLRDEHNENALVA